MTEWQRPGDRDRMTESDRMLSHMLVHSLFPKCLGKLGSQCCFGPSQKLKTPSMSTIWMAGTQLWVITYCPPRHMNRRLDENQRGWDLKGRTDMKQGILSRAVTMAPQQIPQYYLLKYSSVTVLALFLLLSIAVVTKGLSRLHTHTF